MGVLSGIRRMTKRWGLRAAQKANLVKTFVYLIIDYVTFLQRLSPEVRLRESDLNSRVAEWALEIKVPQSKVSRAIAMIGVKPLEMRRAKAAIKMATKTIGCSQDQHLNRCADILGAYGTLKTSFKERSSKRNSWPNG